MGTKNNDEPVKMTTKDGRSVDFLHVIGNTCQAVVINSLGKKEVLPYSQLIVRNPCAAL